MNAKLVRLMVIVGLLGAVYTAPALAQNPIPNLYTSLVITNISGAPVVGGFFTTDVVASITNYGGSSQVGVIGIDAYITYDPTIIRFSFIEPKTGFFDAPYNFSTGECPAGYVVPTATACIHLALTQQPGAGPVFNRTGVVASLHWAGVQTGSTTINILSGNSYLIQYPNNWQYPFNTVTPAIVTIQGQGGQAGTIVGQVIRYGYLGTAPVTVTASISGGPAVVTNTVEPGGTFTLIVPTGGAYIVKASFPGYLTARRENVYVSGSYPIQIGATYLRGGDVNLDNYVNIFDLAMIATWLGGANDLADINDDGFVNIYDLTLAAGSFNQRGPTAW